MCYRLAKGGDVAGDFWPEERKYRQGTKARWKVIAMESGREIGPVCLGTEGQRNWRRG